MTTEGVAGGETVGDADDPTTRVVGVLREVLSWQLAPARWDLVAELVELLAEAANAGDTQLLGRTAAELGLVGPVRITRIGATPREPAPPRIRERVNHLIHQLSGAAEQPAERQGDRAAT